MALIGSKSSFVVEKAKHATNPREGQNDPFFWRSRNHIS